MTTHRLIYVDSVRPDQYSIAFSLALVSQTDYYTGFLTSSPKITIYFSASSNSENHNTADRVESWVCDVCDYKNPPILGSAAILKCNLCGVTRQSTTTSKQQENVYSGNIPQAMSASTSAVSPHTQDPTPCSACTFLNHPSLRACEICGTPLESQSQRSRTLKSAPTSRPDTPVNSEGQGRDSIKLSFRKGGDKLFYAALKRTLMGKAWEVLFSSLSPLLTGLGVFLRDHLLFV